MSLTQKIGQVIALSTLIFGSFIPTAISTTVPQENIQKSEPQILLAQRRSSRAYVCTRDRYGYLNLRTGPSLRNRIIGRINNGQYLTILRSSGNWYKVNHRGRIGWVSGDFVCRGNSSQPVGRTNSKKCNALLASIEKRMLNRGVGTAKLTHDYRYDPVNRPHLISFQMGASGEIGNRAFRKSIASQIISNCKTVGIVKYGAFISSGGYVDQVFGLMPSGKVVQFKCLYGRRRTFKPRWGQAKCTEGPNS